MRRVVPHSARIYTRFDNNSRICNREYFRQARALENLLL
jgi:hypothetical protein